MRKTLLLLTMLMLIPAAGCADERANGPGEDNALPDGIEEWIDYSQDLLMAQAREYEGDLYLLVTGGKQPNGGYNVEITGVAEEADRVAVTVNLTKPAGSDTVTCGYDLKVIEPKGLPVDFVSEGDRAFVPALHGLDWLPPLSAGSANIKIISPAPQDSVPREFTVEGVELVFEGTVSYRLFDSAGKEIESGIASGGHGHHWGYFSLELAVPEEIGSGEALLVQLYSESPKDGSMENLVEQELLLE